MYWFNDMIFIIITSFYYFDKLKQGGISRGIREWNPVRSGGDPFLQREQLHRHGKRRGQPGEWLQAHACWCDEQEMEGWLAEEDTNRGWRRLLRRGVQARFWGDLGEWSLKKVRTGRESTYGTNLMSSIFCYSPILLDLFLVLVLSINLFAVG